VLQNDSIPHLYQSPDSKLTEPSKEPAVSDVARPPERTRYLPGEIIENKYRLVRALGEGGMGMVWIAHNVVLDVQVAIKLIRLELGSSQRLTERLLQEARAAARLGHPGIVRVFDFGVTRHEDPFVVMELLHGETLADLIHRESRLSAISAVQLLLPIADALATAHGKGIVHRDVKPENIFVARDESERKQPKLLDFGIASFVESGNKLTLAGAVLGTPDYMSPEQARGENDADHRTDVWSFCVVLYELLTGRVPFDGQNYNALLRAIINDNPPSIVSHAAGDQPLWQIIERGLRKNADQRWDTMRVLGEALALWLYERGVREDVCAASLKTAWLESGLSGIRIEVGSEPRLSASSADRATPPAPAPNTLPAPQATSEAEAQADGFDELEILPAAHESRRKLALGALVALVVIAIVAGALSLRRSETPMENEPAAASTNAHDQSPGRAPAPSEAQSAAASHDHRNAQSRDPASSGQVTTAQEPEPSAPRSKATQRAGANPAAAKRGPSPEPAGVAHPPRKPAGNKDYDFGF
jgi:eukaryotic-like serine/threonine-protein kinase